MKKVDVILGLQWGDEGKGKVVDVLTPHYQVVARFQGGPNAGHTLEFNGEKYVLRSIPSGIFQGDKVNVIGNGVVLDPILFKEEAEALARSGHDLTERLYISKKAHLILPTHRVLDAAFEAAKGSSKIAPRQGHRPDLYGQDQPQRRACGRHLPRLQEDLRSGQGASREHSRIAGLQLRYRRTGTAWFEGIEYLKKFRIIDSEHEINRFLAEDKAILAEGAQGTLLDVDFGSYPFVTSSNTICAGACTGPRHRSQPYRRGLRHLQGLLSRAWAAGLSRRSCSTRRARCCAGSVMSSVR